MRGGHQKVIASSRAGDVQQVALGVVDLFQVRVIGQRSNSSETAGASEMSAPASRVNR